MSVQASAGVRCIDCGAMGTIDLGEYGGYSIATDTHGWTFRNFEGWLCPNDRDFDFPRHERGKAGTDA